MQGFFTMFPVGWPGIGLLLLRAALSANLLHIILELPPSIDSLWIRAALAAVAAMLCAGLFTPVTALVCAFCEVAAWLFVSGSCVALHVGAILVAVALVMLGPGAYSLDCRLFGRRHVIFPADEDDE